MSAPVCTGLGGQRGRPGLSMAMGPRRFLAARWEASSLRSSSATTAVRPPREYDMVTLFTMTRQYAAWYRQLCGKSLHTPATCSLFQPRCGGCCQRALGRSRARGHGTREQAGVSGCRCPDSSTPQEDLALLAQNVVGTHGRTGCRLKGHSLCLRQLSDSKLGCWRSALRVCWCVFSLDWGGLADELANALTSSSATVDDWIMDNKQPLWEGWSLEIRKCRLFSGLVLSRSRLRTLLLRHRPDRCRPANALRMLASFWVPRSWAEGKAAKAWTPRAARRWECGAWRCS